MKTNLYRYRIIKHDGMWFTPQRKRWFGYQSFSYGNLCMGKTVESYSTETEAWYAIENEVARIRHANTKPTVVSEGCWSL